MSGYGMLEDLCAELYRLEGVYRDEPVALGALRAVQEWAEVRAEEELDCGILQKPYHFD